MAWSRTVYSIIVGLMAMTFGLKGKMSVLKYRDQPWPFGMFVGILFFALIIYLCFRIMQRSLSPGERQPPSKKDNAMEILRTRYAKGEIDQVTFVQMKKDYSDQ